MPIAVEALVARFPLLFHMAEAGSWPSIEEHGLLSTSALLDLFEMEGRERHRLESQHRPDCIPIEHPKHGKAVLRDQKPMDDKGLVRALGGGLKPADWYRILNEKVFFWVSEARLNRLLSAKAYRSRRQTVLIVDAGQLVRRHADSIMLCPMNSGCTKPFPHPRGKTTFQPPGKYPYEERLRVNRREPIVELTVVHSVPDIRDFIIRAYETTGGKQDKILFQRKRR